ncbi:MAG: ABC transporter permease [Chloroflexota bacterium]
MRHIVRHLWLYSLLTLLLTLVAALVGSLPLVANQLAADSLQRSLQKLHPSARHMLLTSDEIPDEVNGRLRQSLATPPFGSLYNDTFRLRDTTILGHPYVQRGERLDLFDPALFDFLNFHLYSFDTLEEHTTLLDGSYPTPKTEETDADTPAPIEVVIGTETAELLGLALGDVIVQRDLNGIAFQVVGLVAPTNPTDPRWWGDELLLPFSFWRRISLLPDFIEITAGLILHPDDMANTFPGNVSWRVLLNGDQLNTNNATTVAHQIRNLEATLTSQRISLDTQLLTLLNQFLDDIASSQINLLLLATQALLAIFYTLYMVGQLVLAQTASELATLAARGFSVGKIRWQFGLRYALLTFGIGLPLGMVLAATSLWQWPLLASGNQPWHIPPLSWGLAAAVLFIAWLILILPVGRAARRALTPQTEQLRHDSFSPRALLFDLAVLGLGLFSFWQLSQFANVALAAETVTLDPLLLLAPTLLFLGAALLLRHLAPLLIQLLARLGSRNRSALLPTALAWLGRERTRSGRLILLVVFASGLALFAAIFTHSIAERQLDLARYQSGADIRLAISEPQLETVRQTLATDDRVGQVAAVFRGTALPEGGSELNLLAIEGQQADVVHNFPPDISPDAVAALLSLLDNPAPDAVPVLISRTYVVPGTAVSDRTTITVGHEQIPVEIRGIIEAFPTLPAPFVIANLEDIRTLIDQQPETLLLGDFYELWVSLEAPVSANKMLADAGLADEIVVQAETAVLHDDFRFNLLARQITGMFRLNVIILVSLSFASLLLLQLLDGWQRLPSLGAMLSLGISRRGLIRLLLWEGIVLMLVGFLVGVGLGFGLVRLTLPLLNLTLSSSLGHLTTAPLVYQWGELSQLLLFILALYGIGITVPALIIGRIDAARLLRWRDV